MAAYATYLDVQRRMTRTLSAAEQSVCTALLEDAAIMIDDYNAQASADAKALVSCRMVIRALGDGDSTGVPIGATQGSMGGLGYTQSWGLSSGAGAGELYIGRAEKKLLGANGVIGSYSPTEELVCVDLL